MKGQGRGEVLEVGRVEDEEGRERVEGVQVLDPWRLWALSVLLPSKLPLSSMAEKEGLSQLLETYIFCSSL